MIDLTELFLDDLLLYQIKGRKVHGYYPFDD